MALVVLLLALYHLDQVGDLLDHRQLRAVLLFLHLELLLLRSLGAYVGVMAVYVAEEAHHALVLFDILLILHQQLVQFICIDWVFLTVRRFVTHLPAVVAPYALAGGCDCRLGER